MNTNLILNAIFAENYQEAFAYLRPELWIPDSALESVDQCLFQLDKNDEAMGKNSLRAGLLLKTFYLRSESRLVEYKNISRYLLSGEPIDFTKGHPFLIPPSAPTRSIKIVVTSSAECDYFVYLCYLSAGQESRASDEIVIDVSSLSSNGVKEYCPSLMVNASLALIYQCSTPAEMIDAYMK